MLKTLKALQGFTLAEVLITLGIIGIIAAMTIPSLLNQTNNTQYVSAFKKEYSTFSQAYNKFVADGNSMQDAFPGTNNGAAALNKIAPYLNLSKNCGATIGCWYRTSFYFLNGSTIYLMPMLVYQFMAKQYLLMEQ